MRTRSLGPGVGEVGIVGYGAWPLSDSSARPSAAEAERVLAFADALAGRRD